MSDFKQRIKMMLLEDDNMADPRYGSGVPSDDRASADRSTRETVEGIYEMLKTILNRLDQNMPYISRACERDGGK